jgi:hypothetical protein
VRGGERHERLKGVTFGASGVESEVHSMRWFYLFASFNRAALQGLLGVESDQRVIQLEDQLRKAMEQTDPLVASYASWMDGWDASHRWIGGIAAGTFVEKVAHDLDARGIWYGVVSESDLYAARSALRRKAPSDPAGSHEVGGYGRHLMYWTVCNWIDFLVACSAAGVVTCRCVGPSFDDSEF